MGSGTPLKGFGVMRLAQTACVSAILLAALTALPDTVTLRNGETIKCKVVKEMKDLVKVRMPRRGKIVTTFLSRGTIESIQKATDVDNRGMFQGGGVRNPGKTFDPVYYSGSAPPPRAGAGVGARGKQPAGKQQAKKRGADERKRKSDERAKSRAASAKGKAGSTEATSPGTSPSVESTSPSTTGSSGTTFSSAGK